MINWKKKLSSRKFWALIAGLVTSLLVCFKVAEGEISQVVAIIGAFGSIIAYIFGEAYVDGKSLENTVTLDLEDYEVQIEDDLR